MMKSIISLFCIGIVAATGLYAQEAGNRAYGNQGQNVQPGGDVTRRYPKGYEILPVEQITTDAPNLLVTTYQFVEAKLLTSVETREYIVVFGLSQSDQKLEAANSKLLSQINGFRQGLGALGVKNQDIDVDFITQNRTYDFQVKGNTAREKVSGFQIKENISIRYQDPNLLDKIIPLAASNGIYDLIKVDYITEDLDAIRARMVDEAHKVIKRKEENFSKLGIKLVPVSVVAENFDTFQPSEAYNSYRAFETGDVSDNYRVVEQRKSSTLYFEPLQPGRFDVVMAPIGLKPKVQCTYYLRVKYVARSYTTVQTKP